MSGGITHVLTDIEGTTTAIAFVHRSLFPYAASALEEFLARHGGEAEVAAVLAEVPGEDKLAQLRAWMAADAKVTPLKALQGLIWREGYEAGALKGHLWPDVPAALRGWRARGLHLAIYSSGSEEAQRLLVRHSEAGDLEPIFDGFFDTRLGMKREAASYAAIARAWGAAPENILFLSDVAEELDAAREAGLATCQLVRAEDGTKASGRHPEAADFQEVTALLPA
ncbi:acireductone synthase [Roseococcus sp. SYP-B2431]|uniref:acireductone synthase n=1 Tax=Roseococcus sp. SYP-B2431 TaxID=2496640 RepID=UPI00103C4023|nr:acireductone synthase [Roseococcus sp. SYP-B2431]TCH96708.1 acireductone synthase [Roseococcus sp. SYP-B2431]